MVSQYPNCKFIYLIRTQLSHSTKLWLRKRQLFVPIMRNLVLLIFSCFKPINSWSEKYGLSYSMEIFA